MFIFYVIWMVCFVVNVEIGNKKVGIVVVVCLFIYFFYYDIVYIL